MEASGIVKGLFTNPKKSVWKYTRTEVRVAQFGFVGDYHCREVRPSHRNPQVLKPNERHITIFGREVYAAINQELRQPLAPGAVGENILVEGLGDLGYIPAGAEVLLDGGRVSLKVVGQNVPCAQLNKQYNDNRLVKLLHERRGLLCSVQDGVGEILRLGISMKVRFEAA